MADEATILDAFVVTLGLDPKQFVAGRKEATAELKKLREDGLKAANEAEASNKRALDTIGKIRTEVLGLALAFAGARGVGDFVGNIIGNDASTGRLAQNIGVATEALSRWQYAVRSVNGSNEDANSSMSRLFNLIETQKFTGTTGADPILARLGVTQPDLDGGPEALIRALAENRMHDTRQERVSLLSQLGIDQNSTNVILQGTAAIDRLNREADRAGVITDRDAKAAEEMQKQWNELSTIIMGKARPAITEITGDLASFAAQGDNLKIAGDAAIGVIGAVGIAAAVAYAPIFALATVVGGLARAYQLLSTAEGRSRVMRNLQEDKNFLEGVWGAFHAGGGAGTTAALEAVMHKAMTGGYRPAGDAPVPSTSANSSGNDNVKRYLMSRGMTDFQAEAVMAGVWAESKGNPNARNASGAYGIGQWLGERKAALFARFGPHPTLGQQWVFLADEMQGKSGNGVRYSKDFDSALYGMIFGFEAPQGRHNEHIADAYADMRRARSFHGARVSAGRGGVSRVTHVHQETHIGHMQVVSPDPKRAGADVQSAIRRRGLTAQANSGSSG